MNTIELIFVIIAYIILLFKNFIFKYFQKKGENLATKEDIEDITTKIETVKLELNQISKHLEFVEENYKKYLLIIFDNYTILIYKLLNKKFGEIYGIGIDYINEIKEYEKLFFETINSIFINYSRLMIYTENIDILNLLEKLNNILPEIEKLFKKNITDIKIYAFNEGFMLSELPNSPNDQVDVNNVCKMSQKVQKSENKYYEELQPLKIQLEEKYIEFRYLIKTEFNSNNLQ